MSLLIGCGPNGDDNGFDPAGLSPEDEFDIGKEDRLNPVPTICGPIRPGSLAGGCPYDGNFSDEVIKVRTVMIDEVATESYAYSYSDALHESNWVSWRLAPEDYGDAERYSGSFLEDDLLSAEGYLRLARHTDYDRSNLDRGHMVRSEERTLNDAMNKSTFFLTNVLPQGPDLNRGPWLALERFVEYLVREQGKTALIVSGGAFQKVPPRIGKNSIAVPEATYKIIAVLEPGQTLDALKPDHVIAVLMPNKTVGRKDPWTNYVTTVDAIETRVGRDFFRPIKNTVEGPAEKADFNKLCGKKSSALTCPGSLSSDSTSSSKAYGPSDNPFLVTECGGQEIECDDSYECCDGFLCELNLCQMQ